MRRLLLKPSFRCLASVMVFVIVLFFHFVWVNIFPKSEPAQERWLTVPIAESPGWWNRYLAGEHYWLGYVYALSIGFTIYALLLYVSSRVAATGRFAIGSLSLSGFLTLFGCFLIGCCGSPMLGVYLSLFGASFLPFAKPLVAVLITLLIAASWIWLNRKHRSEQDSNCQC